jgi:hypothetical protein
MFGGDAKSVARAVSDSGMRVLRTLVAEKEKDGDDDAAGESDNAGIDTAGAIDEARCSGDGSGSADGRDDASKCGRNTVSSTLVGRTMHHVDAHSSELGGGEEAKAGDADGNDKCKRDCDIGEDKAAAMAEAQRSSPVRGRIREASV